VTGIEPACPAWEVQNRHFDDLPKEETYLIKGHFDYPVLPADIRRSPWRGARSGARRGCPVFLAGLDRHIRGHGEFFWPYNSPRDGPTDFNECSQTNGPVIGVCSQTSTTEDREK
jgi:hypothetical protein